MVYHPGMYYIHVFLRSTLQPINSSPFPLECGGILFIYLSLLFPFLPLPLLHFSPFSLTLLPELKVLWWQRFFFPTKWKDFDKRGLLIGFFFFFFLPLLLLFLLHHLLPSNLIPILPSLFSLPQVWLWITKISNGNFTANKIN